MDLAEYLPFFPKLSPQQQGLLTDSVEPLEAKAGTVVHNGSLDCLGLLIIRSGQLRVYALSGEGREITLYRLFDHDICLFSASCVMPDIQFEVIIEAEKALADNYKGKKQEIVLLINDNKVRGKGLGKRLIDEFCLTDESHTPTILCSDKDSNYHFYEHLGFRIIDNKDLPYSLFEDKKVFHSFLFIKE